MGTCCCTTLVLCSNDEAAVVVAVVVLFAQVANLLFCSMQLFLVCSAAALQLARVPLLAGPGCDCACDNDSKRTRRLEPDPRRAFTDLGKLCKRFCRRSTWVCLLAISRTCFESFFFNFSFFFFSLHEKEVWEEEKRKRKWLQEDKIQEGPACFLTCLLIARHGQEGTQVIEAIRSHSYSFDGGATSCCIYVP